MTWTFIDTWIVVGGILSAVSCSLLGNFLVLRRMSMMGDAISHAVLPGLAVAFLISGSRTSLPMFLGAALAGVLTAVFTQAITRYGKVDESASMGVVFTTLFAAGLVLLVRAADSVDLDPGCVLYGAIELVPLDTVTLAGAEVPRVVLSLGVVLGINLLFLILCFKELKISSFDPSLSTTLGFHANVIHYLLMTLVAVTTVACFESVGSILVIAMLVVPPATAWLLTQRLVSMVIVSSLVAVACAVLGHVAAVAIPAALGAQDTSTSGMMAAVAGLLFIGAMLFSPREGVVSKQWQRLKLTLRIMEEDVLGLLYRLEEMQARASGATTSLLADAIHAKGWTLYLTLQRLVRSDRIDRVQGTYVLTESGRSAAASVIRSHRLWETYLHKHLLLPEDHLHAPAERLEHVTDPAMQQQLADVTERPDRDPQGRDIPKSSGTTEKRPE